MLNNVIIGIYNKYTYIYLFVIIINRLCLFYVMYDIIELLNAYN